MPDIVENLVPLAITYGIRVVGVLFALWIAFRLARWLEDRSTAVLTGRGVDQAVSAFLASLVRWGMVTAAVLACLGVFGIETTSFAAILGAAGLAIGLAFQGTLGNFASGVLLLTFRPFTIGDLVQIGGELGTVAQIGLFATSLDTLDNRRIVIPNAQVAGGVLENLTANNHRRVDIDVGVAYRADLDATRAALEQAARSVPHRHAELGHQVIVLGLGESSVKWQVRVWCKTEKYWDVWEATIGAVKRELDAAAIAIPFPQLDVNVRRDA